MKKYEADLMLSEKFNELNEKTKEAKTDEQYIMLVDGMLKIYTILDNADGFEFGFPNNSSEMGS